MPGLEILSKKVEIKARKENNQTLIVSAVLESQIAEFKNEKEPMKITY